MATFKPTSDVVAIEILLAVLFTVLLLDNWRRVVSVAVFSSRKSTRADTVVLNPPMDLMVGWLVDNNNN